MSPTLVEQGAAGVATAVAESVQYQGRKASRQGSEQRRQQILDAAMRIVVRDGVRGVRHRAVAAEAGVPLSATTYYFNDIQDLLTDTFAQYVERSAAYMAKLWENTEVVLRQLLAQGDGSPASRARLADEVAKMTTEYVQRQLHNRRDFLMAEQAFRQEALLSPRLAELVRAHEQILLRGACQLLQVVGSRQPQQDAIVLTAIIEQMEYQGLLDAAKPQAEGQMLAILVRYLHLVLAAEGVAGPFKEILMKAWRVLLALSFLLLNGCLVTFNEPIPANEPAPKALLGKWTSKDAWGEPLTLQISRSGGNAYKALAKAQGKPRQEYAFTVSRHGSRWYLSAGVPKAMGGNFLIGGFEVIDNQELVVYNLDVEQVNQALEKKELSGRTIEVPEDNGDGVLIDSPMERVLAYLDDPANSDLFVEVARFQRAGK